MVVLTTHNKIQTFQLKKKETTTNKQKQNTQKSNYFPKIGIMDEIASIHHTN